MEIGTGWRENAVHRPMLWHASNYEEGIKR